MIQKIQRIFLGGAQLGYANIYLWVFGPPRPDSDPATAQHSAATAAAVYRAVSSMAHFEDCKFFLQGTCANGEYLSV